MAPQRPERPVHGDPDRRWGADHGGGRQRHRDRDRLRRPHGLLLRPRRGRQRRRRQRPQRPATQHRQSVKIDREPPRLAFAAAQTRPGPGADRGARGGSPFRPRPQPRLDRDSSPSARASASSRCRRSLPAGPARALGLERLSRRRVRVSRHRLRRSREPSGLAAAGRRSGDAPARSAQGASQAPRRWQDRAVRYGRGVWFDGGALAARRTPLSGVPVHVIERFAPGAVPQERLSTVRTGENGRFGIRLAPGPSREVIATVASTATTRGASSRPLALAVHSHVSLRASSAIARVGGPPLIFRGRVASKGAAMPAEGKVVQLQFRLPGLPWSEFRSVRTARTGVFATPTASATTTVAACGSSSGRTHQRKPAGPSSQPAHCRCRFSVLRRAEDRLPAARAARARCGCASASSRPCAGACAPRARPGCGSCGPRWWRACGRWYLDARCA